MKAHGATYDGFIGLLKWSVPLVGIVAFVVVLIIA
ncbi:MAG: aa3-type cytochrome c oxidase subunit IV [Sphingomonas sp.]|nr:aa3-type cytochrome c oxidase subunit IV [Sphingomonas sp.]